MITQFQHFWMRTILYRAMGTSELRLGPNSWAQHIAYYRGTVRLCIEAPIEVRPVWFALARSGPHREVVRCGTVLDRFGLVTVRFRCVQAPLVRM